MLDLACGSGEMLCTWARDHGINGVGVDLNPDFVASARTRADELGVNQSVRFIEADAADYVSEDRVDVRPGGMLLIGEPYWRKVPASPEALAGCGVSSAGDYLTLPDLLASFGTQGYDVVEMVCATQQSWDGYQAPQWLAMRRWADANPGHELHDEVRGLLRTEPQQYAAFTRHYFGWGTFALMAR